MNKKQSTDYKKVGRQGPTKGAKKITIDDLLSKDKFRELFRVDVRLDSKTISKIEGICSISGYSRTEVLEALVLAGLDLYSVRSKPFYTKKK